MKRKQKHPVIRRSFSDVTPPGTEHFLAITTLVAVAVVALETVPSLSVYVGIFHNLEMAIVTIFSLEYVTRLYYSPNRLRYMFSFFGIIDLAAILPSYLGLNNLTFLKATRAVRIIRLLRMLRLAKFSEIKRKKNAAQSLYKINLEIYSATLLIATLLLGSLFYVFENHQVAAQDIPSGMWWALRAILGGISYPQPDTLGGTITLILSRFTSMLLLGMLLGLVGTMLRKVLIGSEKDS
ncbi:MAG: hypothetical protein RLZZ360_180 [Candidatus Parcubacteria bacterium]|jgi:voltage-gated potassium channel